MFELIQVDGVELICYSDGNIWRQNKNYKEEVWTKIVSKKKDYWAIEINGKFYLVHRIICVAFKNFDLKSELVIDHINHNIHNNSIENLRVVTQQQNNFNTNAKGYCKRIIKNKNGTETIRCQIRLRINGKTITKCVKTEELARQGYLELKAIHHIIPS